MREGAKAPRAQLKKRMLARLLFERASYEWRERDPRTKRRPKVHFMIAEETGSKPAVGGEPNPVARLAVSMRNGCYNTYRPQGAGRTVVSCGTIAERGADVG